MFSALSYFLDLQLCIGDTFYVLMQRDLCVMHLKISISASIAMAKCMHYVAVSQTEQLICVLILRSIVSEDFDVEASCDLSDDSV
jgi:hypothetical protein